jgi:hypothetical protein
LGGESVLIGITTAYRRTGLAYDRWTRHFGKEAGKVLVIHAPSRVLNPLLSQTDIDEALHEDSEAARADYLSEWRDDEAAFISRELIEAAVDPGITARPYDPRHVYAAFIDASSGTHDSFGLGVAHKEGETVIVDCLVEIPAPFHVAEATARIAQVIKSYGLRSCMGDDHAKGWVCSELARHGIALQPRPNGMDGSVFHLEALSVFGSHRVRLPSVAKVVGQFIAAPAAR